MLAELGPWLRLGPGLCAAWAAVGTALGSPLVCWALVPFAAIGALGQGHPSGALFNHGIRHLLGTRRLPPTAPRRFACAVATVWLGLTDGAFFAAASVAGYALGVAFALAALVPTLADWCLPSFVCGPLVGRQGACPRSAR